MSKNVSIYYDPNVPPSVTFPDKCVYCGATREMFGTLKLERQQQIGNQILTSTQNFLIPLCQKDAMAGRRAVNILGGIIIVGTLVAFFVFFLPSSTATTPSGAVWAMCGGAIMVGVGLAFLVSRFNKVLRDSFAIAFDPNRVLGVGADYGSYLTKINFHFTNDEIGKEFEDLNRQQLAKE